MAKLSIVTICYNIKNVIEMTCESIVNQTWQDFEWIVVDGGSTDGTLDILNKYKDRIDILVSEPDNGVYNALNKGIKLANSEWINFMNGGDRFYDNEVLEKVFKDKTYDADILYGWQYFARSKVFRKFKDNIDRYYLCSNALGHQAIFYKKECFEKYGFYDETFKIYGDFERNVCFKVNKKNFKYLDYPVSYFGEDGISSNCPIEMAKNEITKIYLKYYSDEEVLEYGRQYCKPYFEKRISNKKKFKKFIKNIFSVQNERIRKVITILGIKIKIKSRKLIEKRNKKTFGNSNEISGEKVQKYEKSGAKIYRFLFGFINLTISKKRYKITIFGCIKISHNKQNKIIPIENVCLCSFADDKFMFAQRILNHTANLFGIKRIYSYSPESYKNSDFYKNNSYILNQKRGHGYWLWKPWIILETLNKMKDGEFLIYADSGSFIISDVMPLIKHCKKNKGILVFENEHQYINLHWTKKIVFQIMGADSDEYWYHTQADAAFLVLQKSKYTVKFIKKWLESCTNPMLLTDEQSQIENPACFVDHRHDQSILSILAQKHNLSFFRSPSQYGNYRKSFWLRRFREPKNNRPYSNTLKNSPYGQIFHHHRLKPYGIKYNSNYQTK